MKRPTNANHMKGVASISNNGDAGYCFIVMSFSGDPIIESYYEEGVKPTVERCGLKCIRVDHENFDGTITEYIKSGITNAAIVIVDTTEDKPNCYFEAGYAVAKNKNIIWMRLNAPSMTKTEIQFDVKDYPYILYRTIGDLRNKLESKIRFYIGKA